MLGALVSFGGFNQVAFAANEKFTFHFTQMHPPQKVLNPTACCGKPPKAAASPELALGFKTFYDTAYAAEASSGQNSYTNSMEFKTQKVKISAVGDLMVHKKQYEDALQRGGGEVCDFNNSFSYIKRYFADSDIVAGNLETTLAGQHVGFNSYPCFSVPDEFAYALKNAGFNLLSTANNHCMDRGKDALLRTIETLRNLGIEHIGTYTSLEKGNKITVIEKNGISFAFLAYTYSTNGIEVPNGMVNILDENLYVSDIKEARNLGVDFVIVLPHMGNEYETYPQQQFKDIVDKMFKAGADIVLASHPHVIQPAKFVKVTDEDGNIRQCFVAYSMGNFISGQREWARDAGVIFNLYFEKTGNERAVMTGVSYIPTWVRFYKNGVLDIAVLPVYDALNIELVGGDIDLSSEDRNRIQAVQHETTKLISGVTIPIKDIKAEYFIP